MSSPVLTINYVMPIENIMHNLRWHTYALKILTRNAYRILIRRKIGIEIIENSIFSFTLESFTRVF